MISITYFKRIINLKFTKSELTRKIKEFIRKTDFSEIAVSAGNASFRLVSSAVPFLIVAASLLSDIPEAQNKLLLLLKPILSSQSWGFIKYLLELAFDKSDFPFFSIGTLAMVYAVSSGVFSLLRGMGNAEKKLRLRISAVFLSVLIILDVACVLIAVFSFEIIKNTQALRFAMCFAMLAPVMFAMYLTSKTNIKNIKQPLLCSVVSSAVIVLLTSGMRFYYSEIQPNNIYGSLGGAIIVLSWIYLVSFSVIFIGKIRK